MRVVILTNFGLDEYIFHQLPGLTRYAFRHTGPGQD